MPIPQFSPEVNWGSLGRQYRTGMFIGTLFEYMAQGFVLALMSRYFSLTKQRKASITEQIVVATACLIGVIQMCIHTQMTYHNGILNYLQVTRLALEENWQMRSIWATSSVVWTIGAGLFLWDRKQRLQASAARQGACAIPAFILSSALVAGTAASGVAVAIMRSIFPANAIVTVTGEISMPEGFNTVKRILYVHYGLIVASQVVLSVIASYNVRAAAKTNFSQRGRVATLTYLYRQLMIAPLAVSLAVLLCFVIQPGKNIELIVYLPLSAVSFANVVSLFNQFRRSVINPRVLIPLERTEVIAISDKDSNYMPARIGLNRLPYSASTSTVSQSGYEKEGHSLKRDDSASIF